MTFLRTVLALSRPARLVTVWSNCLAGWWLGGGGNFDHLPFLFGGAGLLFLGGAFLNDAFDADYDREHRPTKPIPSGALTQSTVWRWGLGWLIAGALLLVWRGRLTGTLGLGLVFCIISYNTVHRLTAVGPFLKGTCRCLLYVLGASVAERGVTGWSIWCGIALAAYIAGVAMLARSIDKPAGHHYGALALLAVPIALALLMDVDGYRQAGLVLSAVVAIWIIRSLRPGFWSPEPDLGRTVSGLIAGIVFVDWLATCPALVPGQFNEGPRQLSFAFIGLFLATLLFQRLAPER